MTSGLTNDPSQVFSASVLISCFAVNNLTFGLWRAKIQHSPQPQPTQYVYHPSQPPMGYQPGNKQFHPPYQAHMNVQSMDQGPYCLDGQSPTKRLGYR